MNRGFRNFVPMLLVVSLVLPSAFLIMPKKAEAIPGAGGLECLAGIIAGKIDGMISGIESAFTSVPSYDAAVKQVDAKHLGQTQGLNVQRCIVEPIITMVARTILDKFTAETVRWINSGFQGDPLYVTNLDGFLADSADEVIGRFIYSLGPIGRILCSPFDLQLRLALSLQYRSPDFYRQIGCRLSDIEQNVQRAFTRAGGSFGKDGWSNWLKLTAVPQNNPYGGYLTAVETLDAEIVGRGNIELTQASWGKGFLASKRCVENSKFYNEETGKEECGRWVTETPGTIIEGQLNATLGVQAQKVGLAKDIDAIVDALIGQLINQVLGPGGLLASTESQPRYGGQSAVDRALASTVARINAANNQILPTGIKPPNQTNETFCEEFKNGVFSTPKTPARTDATPVYVKLGDTFVLKITNVTYQWTVADYNAVSAFCRNLPNSSFIKKGVDNFNNASGEGGDIPDTSVQTRQQKTIQLLGPDVKANQSGTQSNNPNANYGPRSALFGGGFQNSSTCTGPTYRPCSTPAPHWWNVTLPQEERINRIEITPTAGTDPVCPDNSTLKGATVSIQTVDNSTTPATIKAKNVVPVQMDGVVLVADLTSIGGILGNRVQIDRSECLVLNKVNLERYLVPVVTAGADAQNSI